jgi:(p)ppGpp synthase/HD superfamily hydrolase
MTTPIDDALARPLSPLFGEAVDLASRLHRHQSRKGTQTPYVAHLLAVCALVLENGGTEDEAIAALLHDSIEDQLGLEGAGVIRDKFGDAVFEVVKACSDSLVPKGHEKRVVSEIEALARA